MTEIRNGRKVLTTPVSAEDIAALHVGDVFYLDGEMVTGRDSVHGRVVDEGLEMPIDIRGKAIMHAGPIIRKREDGSYEMISVGPTTSMRMERFEYEFIRETGVRIIIGKGGMKEKTAAGCKEFGAIHCVLPAGNAVVGAVCVEEITGVEWLDLGMPEACWHCRIREFGPLIVTIDTDGRNYFEEKKVEYNRRKDEQAEIIKKQVHFMK
ncbi:MAG: L(+)-tartrate dehydratase subunit beta [Mogibacterium sp.]|jgi:L(+)-tartrate dehydratase beta subunit|nr:L(+)-tartrate dehydratase subunit beta [Mogibacterium sp.]